MPTFLALNKRPWDASLIDLAINIPSAHLGPGPVLLSTVSALYIELHVVCGHIWETAKGRLQ